MEEKEVIICDIDGVLFDSSKWYNYCPKTESREEWNKFQEYYDVCVANKFMVNFIINQLNKYDIIFLTARENTDILRNATIEQINNASDNKLRIGDNCFMVMRPYNNFESDFVVKEILLKELIENGSRIVLAIDDTFANIEIYKKYNIDTWYYDKFRN